MEHVKELFHGFVFDAHSREDVDCCKQLHWVWECVRAHLQYPL